MNGSLLGQASMLGGLSQGYDPLYAQQQYSALQQLAHQQALASQYAARDQPEYDPVLLLLED